MFHIKAAAVAVSVFVGLSSSPAVSQDLTATDQILCTMKRMGDCKADGTCQWRDVTAFQASRKLKVDFTARKAMTVDAKRTRPMGDIVGDAVKNGVRTFAVARQPGDDARKHANFSIDKSGKLRMTVRSLDPKAPAMVIEAMCVKG